MPRGHDCGPKPVDPTELALWQFASLANWGNLHPEDDNRFYEFVVTSVESGGEWDSDAVQGKLRSYGLPEDLVGLLSNRYWAGRCALIKKQKMETGDNETVF